MPNRPHIVVVGSANIDLTTFTNTMPRPGETIFGREFHLGFGGKGANQAVAAQLCGARVSMVARVGDDLFGPATIRNFQERGIEAGHVMVTRGVSSGVAPIFVDNAGQNRILVVKGANDRLSPQDVDDAGDLLRSADCIVLQLEVPPETVYHTLRFGRKHGIRTVLNPAPGQPLDLEEVANADYVIPNETEAEALGGMPVHNVPEAWTCAATLVGRGLRRVIVTMGENGGASRYDRRGRCVHRSVRDVLGGRLPGERRGRARQRVRGAFDPGRGNTEIVRDARAVRRGVGQTWKVT